MSEEESQTPDTAPAAQPLSSVSVHRKGWAATLIGLYGLSLVAAVVILWRVQPKDSERKAFKPVPAFLLREKKDVVGWVSIYGPIYPPEGGVSWARGVNYWTKTIRKMAENKDVKALVLHINSPGGTIGSVQELHSLINRVRRENHKPVVAFLGDVAASGGYYVAAACDKIVSHPGTILGSIGVIFHHSNVEGLFQKIGIKSDPIKSGKMKDIGSPTRPMTPEEKALVQSLIDDNYNQFLQAVVEGRNMPENKIRPLADGRVFTGRQGVNLGLVDQVGDADDAIGLAAKLGGISGKPHVLRDTDSLSSVLTFLETRFGMWLRPDALLLGEIRTLVYGGLEYRWVP